MVEIPGVSRIAVLSSPAYPGGERYRSELERAAVVRQRAIRFIDVLRPEDFDQAFSALRQMVPTEGLIVMADQLVQTRGADIARLATERKVATVFGGPGRPFVAAGGLMSQSADSARYWRQAATYADRILKGASPADLPVEQPTSFELVINLKTAKALGLTIPPSLLLRADHVIE
jgi:putative ABC transport system substrate-binding protein